MSQGMKIPVEGPEELQLHPPITQHPQFRGCMLVVAILGAIIVIVPFIWKIGNLRGSGTG